MQEGQLCPHISGIIMLPGEKNPKPVIWNCLKEKCHFWMQTQQDNQVHGECSYVIIANCLVMTLTIQEQIRKNTAEMQEIIEQIRALLPPSESTETEEDQQITSPTNNIPFIPPTPGV